MKINFQEKFSLSKKNVLVIIFLLFLIFLCAFILRYTLKVFQIAEQNAPNQSDFKDFYIMITGSSDNADYLQKVYEGAVKVADEYNAVVELLVSKNKAEDISIAQKLEYAQAIGADGVIAYIDSDKEIIKSLKNANGEEIPLISLGEKSPFNNSICYIGPNKFELGKILAKTAILLCPNGGNLLIPVDEEKNTESTNQLILNMKQTLSEYYAKSALNEKNEEIFLNKINIEILPLKNSDTISVDEFIKQEIIARKNINCVLCLNHADTLRVCQAILDVNRTSVLVIGYNESEKTLDLLKKGVLQALISFNAEETGKLAMKEIFEYIKNGNANVYVANDIRVLRGKNFSEINFNME